MEEIIGKRKEKIGKKVEIIRKFTKFSEFLEKQ